MNFKDKVEEILNEARWKPDPEKQKEAGKFIAKGIISSAVNPQQMLGDLKKFGEQFGINLLDLPVRSPEADRYYKLGEYIQKLPKKVKKIAPTKSEAIKMDVVGGPENYQVGKKEPEAKKERKTTTKISMPAKKTPRSLPPRFNPYGLTYQEKEFLKKKATEEGKDELLSLIDKKWEIYNKGE